MRVRIRCWPIGLALLAFLASGGPALARGPLDPTTESERTAGNRPSPEWWEGPVRYALADEEIKDYRTLDDPAQRAAFIARFWAARDPDPYTPENEAEEEFFRRVAVANALFSQTTISGWRTDRGRVYIVLGPPDEISDHPVPSVDELEPSHYVGRDQQRSTLQIGHRGSVEWVYRSLRSPLADAGQTITFLRDETGEYRMLTPFDQGLRYDTATPRRPAPGYPEPRSTSRMQLEGFAGSVQNLFAFGQAPLTQKTGGGVRSADDLFAFGQTSLLERLEAPKPAGGRVSASEIFGVVLVQHRVDFFQGTSGTHTLVTLGVPKAEREGLPDAAAPVEIFGHVEKVGDPTQVFQFSANRPASDPVPVQRVDGIDYLLYQIRGILPPGVYRMSFGARIGDRIGSSGDRLEVPDFSGTGLNLAGPVLAEKLGERAVADEGKAFTIGNIRMIPKLESTYDTGADFGFYFQVYRARPDPDRQKIHLDIEYSLAVRDRGRFRPLGRPVRIRDNAAPTHGYSFPLKGWPAGEYLLTVTVTDRVAGEVQAGIAAFRVR